MGVPRRRGAAVALAAAVPAAFVAAPYLVHAGVPCPLKALAGLDCPLCGGTRAAAALGRGNLVAALDHNVLATVAVVPALVVVAYMVAGQLWTGRPVRTPALRWWMVAVLVVFGVVRNLPFAWAEPLRSTLYQ